MGRYLHFGGVRGCLEEMIPGKDLGYWSHFPDYALFVIQHKTKNQRHSQLYRSSTSNLNEQYWVSDMHITAHAR